MKKLMWAAIGIAAFLIVSCQTVTFQGIQAVKDLESFEVIGQFQKEIADPHIFLSLIALGEPDQRIFVYIKEEIEKLSGDAAINVEIDYGYGFFDLLINMTPIGFIYSPRTITIKGTVVKFN